MLKFLFLIILLNLYWTSEARAQPAEAQYLKHFGLDLQLTPAAFYEQGKYEIENGIDAGKYKIYGASLKYGLAVWRFFVGYEKVYGKAQMESDGNFKSSELRENHPIVNDDYRAEGYFAGMRLGKFTFYYTRLDKEILKFTGADASGDVSGYNYEGSGERYGFRYGLGKLTQIVYHYHKSTYRTGSVEGVGYGRVPLKTEGHMVSIDLKFSFETLSKLIKAN